MVRWSTGGRPLCSDETIVNYLVFCLNCLLVGLGFNAMGGVLVRLRCLACFISNEKERSYNFLGVFKIP